MEGTFRDQIQLPGHFRDNQKLRLITEDIVRMPLERWQAWGTNHLTRKPMTVSDHSHGKEFSLNFQFEPLQHSFVPFLIIICLLGRRN